ncbi:calcium/sodium antiporter [Leucobacter sp. W1038]|uniref:calcium/sodium antiporter n=1 Tax=Leucobacter sp. W1038 TaxID=3438281 RepID=UPI003D9947CD
MLLDIVFVIAGIVILVAGGEALVRGASTLATRVGISPLIVGLVVVSAATSAPELAVTVDAVLRDEPDLALGNVVGSNIANILLILGISALVLPLSIKKQIVRFDVPVMVGMSILLIVVSLDGQIGLLDGLLLLTGLVVHTVMSIAVGRREGAANGTARVQASSDASASATRGNPTPLWLASVLLVVGLGLLVLGAQLLVNGAVGIATELGVSSLIVGLTVVAVGTSLPELATSIIAVRRGERDMAVGNIVGSNIFNIGMVLGVPAIIFGQGIPVPAAAIALDLPLMLAASIALLPIAFTGFIVARWEGGTFVALYVAYTAYLVLAATQHDALEGLTDVMIWFVLPLVGVTLVVVTAFEVGVHRGKRLAAAERRDNQMPAPPLE